MNKDLRTISILFGQFTSVIFVILAIWIASDTEILKKLLSYLWFKPIITKILLTIIVLIGSSYSIYRTLLLLRNSDKTNEKDNDE